MHWRFFSLCFGSQVRDQGYLAGSFLWISLLQKQQSRTINLSWTPDEADGYKGLCWYSHPLSCKVQVKERILLCVPSCWSPKLSTEKYSHNLKVGLFYLMGMFRTLSPGESISVALGTLPPFSLIFFFFNQWCLSCSGDVAGCGGFNPELQNLMWGGRLPPNTLLLPALLLSEGETQEYEGRRKSGAETLPANPHCKLLAMFGDILVTIEEAVMLTPSGGGDIERGFKERRRASHPRGMRREIFERGV